MAIAAIPATGNGTSPAAAAFGSFERCFSTALVAPASFMLLGYNTNGFACHRLNDAVAILAGIGYRSIAVTLEHDHLDPPDGRGVAAAVEHIKSGVEPHEMRVTIETGSRFILDPRRKHQPTLISAVSSNRRRRLEFLKAAVDIAAAVSADSVSLWSGAPEDAADEDEVYHRLTASLRELLDHAETGKVRLSFEPEPGMFIDTMARFERLYSALDHPLFGLTLDVGHVHCLGDGHIGEHVRRWKDVLWNVHIEDMRPGVHEHLMFGEGNMGIPAVVASLSSVGYAGPVHVELPRHSHNAVEIARQSYDYLRAYDTP